MIKRLLLLLAFLPEAALAIDCNYQMYDTPGFCTLTASEKQVDGAADVYPQTDGTGTCAFNYGYDGDHYSDMPRDRNAAYCNKLSGINQRPGNAVSTFRVEATGSLCIDVAAGDANFGKATYFIIKDGTSTKSTCIDAVQTTAGQFYDASCVKRTSPADWNTNHVSYCGTFATNVRIELGHSGAAADDVAFAHVRVYDAPATPTPTPTATPGGGAASRPGQGGGVRTGQGCGSRAGICGYPRSGSR